MAGRGWLGGLTMVIAIAGASCFPAVESSSDDTELAETRADARPDSVAAPDTALVADGVPPDTSAVDTDAAQDANGQVDVVDADTVDVTDADDAQPDDANDAPPEDTDAFDDDDADDALPDDADGDTLETSEPPGDAAEDADTGVDDAADTGPEADAEGDVEVTDAVDSDADTSEADVAVDCSNLSGACTLGAYDADAGSCVALPTNEGQPCLDADLCTLVTLCVAGECLAMQSVTCDAASQCHDVGSCDPGTGLCSEPEKAAGSGCDDGQVCTPTDRCFGGVCVGSGTPDDSLGDWSVLTGGGEAPTRAMSLATDAGDYVILFRQGAEAQLGPVAGQGAFSLPVEEGFVAALGAARYTPSGTATDAAILAQYPTYPTGGTRASLHRRPGGFYVVFQAPGAFSVGVGAGAVDAGESERREGDAVYVAAYDADFTLEWAREVVSESGPGLYFRASVTSGGNLALVISLLTGAGDVRVVGAGTDADIVLPHGDYYLVSYDPQGALVSARPAASTRVAIATGPALDGAERWAVCGIITGQANFGESDGTIPLEAETSDGFVALHHASGQGVEWAVQIGGVDTDEANAVQHTPGGGFVVAGHVWGAAWIADPTGVLAPIPRAGLADYHPNSPYVVKLDASGRPAWASSLQAVESAGMTAGTLRVSPDGRVTALMIFQGAAHLTDGGHQTHALVPTSGDRHHLVVQYHPNGDLAFARVIAWASEWDAVGVAGIVLSEDNALGFFGHVTGTFTLGGGAPQTFVTSTRQLLLSRLNSGHGLECLP